MAVNMKIMKTRELPDGTGVLLVSCVYFSFQRSDLPLIRSAMREVMHFVMLKRNRKLEDQSYRAMRQLEKDHDFTSEYYDADDIEGHACNDGDDDNDRSDGNGGNDDTADIAGDHVYADSDDNADNGGNGGHGRNGRNGEHGDTDSNGCHRDNCDDYNDNGPCRYR